MGDLSNSFSSLETKARSINAAQTLQAETQARLHDQMEIDMQVAQGYLSEVASTALQLQTVVSEASSRIQSMTTFAQIFRAIFDWVVIACIGLVGCLAFAVLVMIWRYSRRAAVVIITGISTISDTIPSEHVLMSNTAMTSLIILSGAQAYLEAFFNLLHHTFLLVLNDPFSRASAIFGICSFIGVICYSTKARKRFHERYSL